MVVAVPPAWDLEEVGVSGEVVVVVEEAVAAVDGDEAHILLKAS